MHGVHLEEGCYEEGYNPVVVNVVYVGVVTINGGGKEGEEYLEGVLKEQQGGEDETEVGEDHDAAQAVDGEVGAEIYLRHLYDAEAEGSEGEEHGAEALHWDGANAEYYTTHADDHEEATEGKEDGLKFS